MLCLKCCSISDHIYPCWFTGVLHLLFECDVHFDLCFLILIWHNTTREASLGLQGVWERDEIRKDDSFATFEEIFEIASSQKVDMVLLGGDLFHDNKPSRTTLVRTMDILTRHCLNDRPVSIQVLSDQAQNFASR